MWNKIGRALRVNTLIGFFLIAPLVGTLLVFNFVVKLATNHMVPMVLLESRLGLLYRFAALLVVVIGLYLIGLLARNVVGRGLYRVADRIVSRIPVINSIYMPIRQISESLVSSRNSMFQAVVAVPFMRPGFHAVGFVTGKGAVVFADGMPADRNDELLSVFVPTAPNPTSGFLIMVARSELRVLSISVTDAMKMVMSAGAVLPGASGKQALTLLDHLEMWLKQKDSSGPTASAKLPDLKPAEDAK